MAECAVKHKMQPSHFPAPSHESVAILAVHMRLGPVAELVRTRLKQARERRGMTQAAVARAIRPGFPAWKRKWATQANVSKVESGALEADIDTIVLMSEALKVPLGYLTGTTEVGSAPAPAPHRLVAALAAALGRGAPEALAEALVAALEQQVPQPEREGKTAPTRAGSR